MKRQYELLSLFLPEVNPVLKNTGVPVDFRYLVIYNKYQSETNQSNLLDHGVFWCLTEDLAADLDLQVNDKIDERKNFFVATDAAIIGLRRNNVLYNNWGTTLFAALAQRDIVNLLGVNKDWNSKKYLPLDGPAYSAVIQFLAFKMVVEEAMGAFKPNEEKVVYSYPYGSGKTLNSIAADLRLEPSELKAQNMWLKEERMAKDALPVLIIVSADRYNDVRVLAEISSNTDFHKEEKDFPILTEEPSLAKERGGQFFRINGKKGIKADFCDSYVDLAYKAKISEKSFLEYNDMQENDVVSIGQIYYLEEKDNKGPIATHISREGEGLWDIAMLYGVKLDELLKFNRLESVEQFQRGRVVYLQDKREKNAPVEYVEIKDIVITKGEIKKDPILGTHTAFSFSEGEVIKPATVKKVVEEAEIKVAEAKPIAKRKVTESKVAEAESEKPKPVVKEVSVKPVLASSYSENLKNQVLGTPKVEKKEIEDFVIHTVRKGETLYRISVNYRVTVKQLYKLNSLTSNIIEIGDRIKVKPI
ncbi:LysM peptidoglycan-binding domain-containing protein [uncultured Arcticibacterium sp.]|uniref:LysM peptidoglycan-binding domain-containing protein n=1 Tax=uncultured Arcticibacterium sp. TaxID=2173042 RepID=UPI0030F95930